jgi:serine/threonine-protein kinase
MAESLKGKYLLERCIGCGGMAEVFAGRTIGTAGFSRQVAIKRILSGYSGHARFREMFATEARLSASLRHSNVVSVLDFDEDEAGGLFLVMEYVDGIDLDGLVRTGLLPLPVALFVTGEILRGLAYAHELPRPEDGLLGLVHRDVSPQNVLLSWDGAVQVSDFGIAKARAATQASASASIKGKPAYMSPEQARGLALDGRSDVFAVGIMLWEMLSGEMLFYDPTDVGATLAAVIFRDAPPPSSRGRRPVPGDVEHVTMQMLRRSREERYTAAAALAALSECADYPRRGREALAAILAERLPARAPRPGEARPPRPAPLAARPVSQHAAEATPLETPILAPHERDRPRPIHTPGAVAERIRRRGMRRVLLGAAAVGALTYATLHLTLRGRPPAAQGAPMLPAPEQPGAIERARPAEMPRTEPLDPTRAAESSPVSAPPPLGGAALLETPKPSRSPKTARRDDAATVPEQKPRVLAPAAVRPPAKSGMRIIDLRPEAPESD